MGILNKFLAYPNVSTAKHFAALGAPILFTVGIFLAVETLVVPIFSTKVNQSQTGETLPEVAAQVSCIDRVLARVSPQAIDLTAYRNVWDLCGLEGFNALSLEDFRIRREKFLRQELDERVTLALVVGITISGVVMAGLQLFMSYKLAQTGHAELAKDIELSVQQGKIALKSSVIETCHSCDIASVLRSLREMDLHYRGGSFRRA